RLMAIIKPFKNIYLNTNKTANKYKNLITKETKKNYGSGKNKTNPKNKKTNNLTHTQHNNNINKKIINRQQTKKLDEQTLP
ncbi:hypothetical protein NP568_24775, partial [Vibrio parahaemolyticus]|nr:hypothetical protein [Vibrio parahaemolyticus]